MYDFQPYDPAKPRMVTSFKGNQKLIFEGYRYNIHHIVPAKGVKTWRCVCAKKLTSARSWCKGRAETWDNDSQGISKGEHNHVAEHDVAELEYFKSQLILAAIDQPTAPLNDLIDEAAAYMSPGVSFGSRESLKKSLTVARKSAENGGFKLKCYKNSEQKAPRSLASDATLNPELKFQALFQSGTMASLLSLARQCQNNQKVESKDDDQDDNQTDQSNDQSTSSVSSIFNSFSTGINGNGDYHYDTDESVSPAKMPKFEPPESPFRAGASPFDDSTNNNNGIGNGNHTPTLSSHHFDYSGINSPSNRATPIFGGLPNQVLMQKKNAIDKAIRTARVNDIFNKLSQKVATAASGSINTSPEMHNTSSSSVGMSANTSVLSITTTQKRSIETQTDFGCQEDEGIRLSTCLGNGNYTTCGCRVIRVCCCEDATCRRGLKRSANGC